MIKRTVLAAIIAGGAIASADEAAVVNLGGTKISLYGRLELNSSYDDGKTEGPWSQMAPSGADTAQGRTYFGIGRTRLGFNLTGPQKEGEPEASGRFEVDFANTSAGSVNNAAVGALNNKDDLSKTTNASTLRIRQAYGQVKFKDLGLTLLFGQTDDVITPLDPSSVNPGSLNGAGNLGTRRPQIRVTQALGIAEIAVAATQDRGDANPSKPGVQGRLGMKMPATWAGEKANLSLGVSGHFALEKAATDDNEKRNKAPSSHSINADISLPLMDMLTLSGEFFMGQDLRNYANGSLNLKPGDAPVAAEDPNNVREDGIGSMGWWGSLAAKLPSNLSAGAGVGMENLDKDSRIGGKAESNMFVFANLAYNFTSTTKLTAEWLHLSTDYTNKTKKEGDVYAFTGDKVAPGSLNRFELNFRYDFK